MSRLFYAIRENGRIIEDSIFFLDLRYLDGLSVLPQMAQNEGSDSLHFQQRQKVRIGVTGEVNTWPGQGFLSGGIGGAPDVGETVCQPGPPGNVAMVSSSHRLLRVY